MRIGTLAIMWLESSFHSAKPLEKLQFEAQR
jgi:hypothetical protein